MNSALRKAPPPSSYNSTSKDSSAVQKSKSYSNFDFVRRDLNFQVCITTLKKYTGWTQKYITTLSVHPVQTNKHAFGRLHRCVKQKIKISQKTLTKYVHPNGKHKPFILAILSNLTNINGGGMKYSRKVECTIKDKHNVSVVVIRHMVEKKSNSIWNTKRNQRL